MSRRPSTIPPAVPSSAAEDYQVAKDRFYRELLTSQDAVVRVPRSLQAWELEQARKAMSGELGKLLR